MPSFTFSSTANAAMLAGLTPVFAEVDPRAMNLDPADVARRITPRTRAIVPVHYAGVACRMRELSRIAESAHASIVEDAAHAVGARLGGRALGTLGFAGCLSFHDTKNVTSGEGGALLLGDEALARRAEIIREKGTNRAQFVRGLIDKYTWVDVGSSFLLAEPLAALLGAQLDAFDEMTARRRAIHEGYLRELGSLEARGILGLPRIPASCESNYHLFHLMLGSHAHRDELMRFLRSRNIGAAFHYVPLHSAPVGRRLGWRAEDLPVTEDAAARLLRIPLYPDMTESDSLVVVEAIGEWAKGL
jgi:dTDP-4-amino-4,6-dideoxygalactose transaminase